MVADVPVTETQRRYAQLAGWRRFFVYLFLLATLLGLVALAGALYGLYRYAQFHGQQYANPVTHFKYGSIGAELENGLPYKLLLALPKVFPEKFDKDKPFARYGFLYEDTAPDKRLPVGFAKGNRRGVEVAWFNCGTCHTGIVTRPGAAKPEIIAGMPANTVQLERFFLALFDMAVDKHFSWESPELRKAVGADDMSWLERFEWQWVVMPNTRATLIRRRSELLPLLDPLLATRANLETQSETCSPDWTPAVEQRRYCAEGVRYDFKPYPPYRPREQPTPWGPGRVDTFNPYKLIQFNVSPDCLRQEERTGATDFPSIFLQAPREDQAMHLHWDGNNASLKERNLSAALGAGVTEATVNHRSVESIAKWLRDLAPPPSPYVDAVDKNRVARGKGIYMTACADCHGYQGEKGYVFEGARLGQVEPIEYIGTDPARLGSYTVQMEKYQKDQLFCRDQRYRFRYFKKTNGYANMPLDGLWLRAPYLHNGSVPNLYYLLAPPVVRPAAFVRGLTKLDDIHGGFEAPSCDPRSYQGEGFCFDTALNGNRKDGHLHGTELPVEDRRDLLQYLLTF